MTRYAAILTLALTAAVNAGDGQYIVDKDTAHIPLDSVMAPNDSPSIYGDDLELLVAFVAVVESDGVAGTNPANTFELLLDMGFRPAEAEAMVRFIIIVVPVSIEVGLTNDEHALPPYNVSIVDSGGGSD